MAAPRDFKPTLETMDAALDTLAEIPARRIVVLGSTTEPPGSQRTIYRRLGRRIAMLADRAVLLGKPGAQSYSSGAVTAGLSRTALVDARYDIRVA